MLEALLSDRPSEVRAAITPIAKVFWNLSSHDRRRALDGLIAASTNTQQLDDARDDALKVVGVDMFSVGQVQPEDASYKSVESGSDGRYRLFVFRDNRLVGAILLGDTRISATVQKAVEQAADLSALRDRRPTADDVAEYLAGHVE